jgi:hypothetical protein
MAKEILAVRVDSAYEYAFIPLNKVNEIRFSVDRTNDEILDANDDERHCYNGRFTITKLVIPEKEVYVNYGNKSME